MMKLFRRRRTREAETSFDAHEGSYMTTSTRTGGYEIARESDFQSGEEDTILDQSLYTATDNNSLLDKSTVVSTATTVKQSSGLQQMRRKAQTRPVLQTGDIRPALEDYQYNRQSARCAPRVVTPDAESSNAASLWSCTHKTPREERSSDFYSPDSLKGLDLVPSPELTDLTEEPMERIGKIEPSSYRFEFASMEEPPKRKNDDEENTSVHSFSFSQTEEEIGFEVDDPFCVIDRPSEDRDDESSCSELSVDVSSRVHITDSDLLGGRSSPGALRLTEEGLTEHTKKTFQQARKQPEKYSNEFEAWRKEHETRKWYRQKLKEREQKLLDQSLRLRENQSSQQLNEKRGCSVSFRSETDVAELSLAPLEAMQHLNLNKHTEKKRSFPLFRKKGKPTTEELLDRERQRTREAKRMEEYQQRQERERIARQRREYLERQRAKEIVSGGTLQQSESVDTNGLTTGTMSSVSTATPNLPYCVLCLEELRTHVATPCMHFSFCARCVEKLEKSDKNECPVCRQPNVSYVSVAV